jgi:hypothetical protein
MYSSAAELFFTGHGRIRHFPRSTRVCALANHGKLRFPLPPCGEVLSPSRSSPMIAPALQKLRFLGGFFLPQWLAALDQCHAVRTAARVKINNS